MGTDHDDNSRDRGPDTARLVSGRPSAGHRTIRGSLMVARGGKLGGPGRAVGRAAAMPGTCLLCTAAPYAAPVVGPWGGGLRIQIPVVLRRPHYRGGRDRLAVSLQGLPRPDRIPPAGRPHPATSGDGRTGRRPRRFSFLDRAPHAGKQFGADRTKSLPGHLGRHFHGRHHGGSFVPEARKPVPKSGTENVCRS